MEKLFRIVYFFLQILIFKETNFRMIKNIFSNTKTSLNIIYIRKEVCIYSQITEYLIFLASRQPSEEVPVLNSVRLVVAFPGLIVLKQAAGICEEGSLDRRWSTLFWTG